MARMEERVKRGIYFVVVECLGKFAEFLVPLAVSVFHLLSPAFRFSRLCLDDLRGLPAPYGDITAYRLPVCAPARDVQTSEQYAVVIFYQNSFCNLSRYAMDSFILFLPNSLFMYVHSSRSSSRSIARFSDSNFLNIFVAST